MVGLRWRGFDGTPRIVVAESGASATRGLRGFIFDIMDVDDLRSRAAQRLPRHVFDYFAGGADEERTLADSAEGWGRYRLRPRVLRDVSDIDTGTRFLGAAVAAPLGVAPMAVQGNVHPDGEVAMATGAASAGGLMVVSTLASRSLAEVAAAEPTGPRWFQLYLRSDRDWGRGLVGRAEVAGYDAIVLTVDVPVLGRRLGEEAGFALRDGPLPPNLRADTDDPADPWATARPRYASEPGVTFSDLEALVASTQLPVLVKGVLRGDDAVRCVDAGAAGIVVSNHGGRQLDGAVATAQALPEVARAVRAARPDVEVYVDGGIRRGADVLVAIALGARGVLVGRSALWALAVDGPDGVEALLRGLTAELSLAMRLCGAVTVDDLTPDLVVSP
jgi:4-hydroxymandelate oxidase